MDEGLSQCVAEFSLEFAFKLNTVRFQISWSSEADCQDNVKYEVQYRLKI